MKRLLIRLDDACEYLNLANWERIESLLDLCGVKPLVGIIPSCNDSQLKEYGYCDIFWNSIVKRWISKGWEIALHGFDHCYISKSGGVNPVNNRSEFAGVDLETQKKKIKEGIKIFKSHGIETKVFFAPSHTFDINTLTALKEESDIRIISDTIATDIYYENDFVFVPEQSGKVRYLPFKTVTFCYHPNTMKNKDFIKLERFLKKHFFSPFPITNTKRKKSWFDRIVSKIYFFKRKVANKV